MSSKWRSSLLARKVQKRNLQMKLINCMNWMKLMNWICTQMFECECGRRCNWCCICCIRLSGQCCYSRLNDPLMYRDTFLCLALATCFVRAVLAMLDSLNGLVDLHRRQPKVVAPTVPEIHPLNSGSCNHSFAKYVFLLVLLLFAIYLKLN